MDFKPSTRIAADGVLAIAIHRSRACLETRAFWKSYFNSDFLSFFPRVTNVFRLTLFGRRTERNVIAIASHVVSGLRHAPRVVSYTTNTLPFSSLTPVLCRRRVKIKNRSGSADCCPNRPFSSFLTVRLRHFT